MEEIHTEAQGIIKPPHLATTLIYDMPGRWSTYLNMCVAKSSLEDVGSPGAMSPFSLETILLDLEGGR